MAGPYSLRILASARRQLLELPPVVRQRIRVAIRRLAHDPRPARAKLLSGPGTERIWRLRVGDYRVLYEIRDEQLAVLVIRIAHRRDVYRSG